MVSDAQQQANEQNAQLGGVKTEEGKAVSKYNAQKHAILRQTITEYEQEFYEQVLSDLFEELKPEGAIERILVERMAIHYVKLYRAAKAENEYFKARFNPSRTEYTDEYPLKLAPFPGEIHVKGYSPKITIEDVEHVTSIYARYETTVENRFYKAMHELERVRRMKQGEKIPAPVSVDVEVSKMDSFGENPIQE